MTEPLLPDSLALAIGCHHDGPGLADLSRARLPSMPHLHDEELWSTTYRFGPGFHPRDRYFPVLREQGERSDVRDERVVAFAWVDAALDEQAGVAEPWWCLNAIAVADGRSGAGLGSYLVRKVVEQARAAGVSTLYGQTPPEAAGFWDRLGFRVGGVDEMLASDRLVTLADGRTLRPVVTPEPGHRFFVLNGLQGPTDAPRLLPAQYES